jgi:uncharacterized protein YdhG (YjbR/CyaY superfamily)
MLRQLRQVMRRVAPKAEETISYGMPYYSYHGRLVYFAAFRDHVSLFVMGASQRLFARQTKKYKSGRATLQFPLGTALPTSLITKLIRARLNEVQAARKFTGHSST